MAVAVDDRVDMAESTFGSDVMEGREVLGIWGCSE